MAYLIGQMAIWLLAVAVLCAVSGWFWHAMQSTPHLDALERERDRLRVELLAFGLAEAGDNTHPGDAERELAMMSARADVSSARVAELDRALAEARDGRDRAAARIAELERTSEHARAGDVDALQEALARNEELQREIARLQALPRVDEAADAARAWRLRYFEQRVKYLESRPATLPVADPGADIEGLRARIAELEAMLAGAAQQGDERNALHWRARYLQARVNYLESPEARALAMSPPSAPSEEDMRQRWRMRYLEARAKHLGEGAGAAEQRHLGEIERLCARIAGLEAGDLQSKAQFSQMEIERDEARTNLEVLAAERDALMARCAALEDERAGLASKDEVTRLGWRNRYLDARVRHFEELLADAAKPQPIAALAAIDPPEPAPAPLVPQGEEVRPQSLPAARGGAPDDLTLIVGIGPKIESTLHALGVYHFDQIAAWRPANIAWVDQYLRFRGRITREDWVGQAQALVSGDFTIDQRRYVEPEPA